MTTTTTTVPTFDPVPRPQPVHDALVMLGRQVRHVKRYPEMTITLLAMPLIFLLLFVYVFGGTLGAGLAPGVGGLRAGAGSGGRGEYANYVVPAILLLTIASIAAGTSTSVAMDMAQGIISRFRTMSISAGAVLTGHAGAAVLQALGSYVVVLAVGMAVGFRPQASLVGWLGVAALLIGVSLSVAWLSVACGLLARSVESASNYPMPLLILPFLGSGFVPPESMPAGMSWFAQNQPFTPIMDTLRGLLLGTPVATSTAWLAAGWCVALTLGGWLWARYLYARPRKVTMMAH
jgi:ABC-2 type transport system permease protein